MEADKEDAFNIVTALCSIEKQLKRIADKLDAWECEGALGTFECNSSMKK